MMTNTPLNPAAVEIAARVILRAQGFEPDNSPRADRQHAQNLTAQTVRAYLAVTQPVVNSVEELDKLPAGSLVRAGGREFYKTSYIEHPWVLSRGVDRFGSGYLAKHSNVVVVHRPEVPVA